MVDMKNYLQQFSESLFKKLLPNEELSLSLHSEDSLFLRFNNSKVRQNTTVSQHELTLTYQAEKRIIKYTFPLTLELTVDLSAAVEKMSQARNDLPATDENPQSFSIVNNGASVVYKKIDRPNDEAILKIISELFSDSDLAGFWCSGPLRKASVNSKGQFHYFETDYFFFDYSLYNGPKAAKGFYSGETWDLEHFKIEAAETKNKLNLLLKPTVPVLPGKYRVYLEPMAVAEILGTMAWGALSQAAYHQGRSPFKKLKEKESLLSEKFSLIENFDLGLCPMFNSFGEISTSEISLIKNGQLNSFLTSTATAQEYGLIPNQASSTEMPRSPEICAGSLEQKDILKKLGTGLYISNLHYINWSDLQTARLTGMTRFACFWVENGEIMGPISDLRFDATVYHIFGAGLIDLTAQQEIFVDTATYQKRSMGGMKVPGALIEDFNFTL